MRIRQTFELSTIVTWAHIEDESFHRKIFSFNCAGVSMLTNEIRPSM
ncbi:MAG: hypothetical protein U0X93_09170 [Anaerolineales bacterium]